jgi:hypothetical protein
MVYLAGRPDHKKPHDEMVDHLVGLVEDKARDVAAQKLQDDKPSEGN